MPRIIYHKNMRYIFIALIISIAFISCTSSTSGKKDESLMSMARGKSGEVILVMDSTKWEGELGDAVRNIFMSSVEGLPRPESHFTIRYVDPRKLNDVLKGVKNMIFVTTFDSKTKGSRTINNYFTKESRAKIKSNENLFLVTDKNVFAKGQEVMYLFGNNQDILISHLKENTQKLRDHFNSIEAKRTAAKLYKGKRVVGIENALKKKHNCFVKVPYGFKLVQEEKGFIWMRRIDTDVDRDIFIGYQDYTDESVFEHTKVMAFRHEITKQYLFDDPAKPQTYVTVQKEAPLFQREVNFHDKYAIETKGLWKTNNNSMGGPFKSYLFVDESMNRVYYIEGFVYSPGKKQREIMREIDVILSTFRTANELEK